MARQKRSEVGKVADVEQEVVGEVGAVGLVGAVAKDG